MIIRLAKRRDGDKHYIILAIRDYVLVSSLISFFEHLTLLKHISERHADIFHTLSFQVIVVEL